MAIRQVTNPKRNIGAIRGWCLKYVDDGVGAPKRTATATIAYNTVRAKGHTRAGTPPVGVWVPIWFSLTRGVYAGYGHVAWAYNRGNGIVEIWDSEVAAGARSPYTSISQVLAWFSAHGITYLGWSYSVDGKVIVEDYTPAPAPSGRTGRIAAKGTATVTVNRLNVRTAPSRGAPIRAQYTKGQKFTYDSYQINDGFVWLSYVSYSGVRSYIAEGPNDGRNDTVYVRGGV